MSSTPPASSRPRPRPQGKSGDAVRYVADAYAYSLSGGLVASSVARHPRAAPPLASSSKNDVVATSTGNSTAARALLITDATCDLPETWLAKHGVLTLPFRVRNPRGSQTDGRSGAADIERRAEFYDRELTRAEPDAQALPLSVVGTGDYILEHLQESTDFVLEIAQASRRGNAYLNSLTAAQNLMLQHGRARRQQGIAAPFKMWVIDSSAALNGHGVLVCESARLLDDGMTMPRVVQQIDSLRQHVQTLIVPADVSFFQRRSRIVGDAPLHWLSYGVGKVLDRTPLVRAQGSSLSVIAQVRGYDMAVARAFDGVAQCVRAGLAAPFVCVSFAGDAASIRQWPAFIALQDACLSQQVTLHVATMSMSNALMVGRGALAISFASDP